MTFEGKSYVTKKEALDFLNSATKKEIDEIVKEFTHLHSHTKYSLADSLIKPSEAAKASAKFGMKSLAISDHGVLFGVIDFYKACKRENIKPIIGMETYVAPASNKSKVAGIDNANYHLVLLAMNNAGLDNLYKIASDAGVNGFYYKARTDKKVLRDLSEGLIATSACMGSEINKALMADNFSTAAKVALEYEDIFGKGNFFLEIMDHNTEEDKLLIPKIIKLSEDIGVPLVCTNDNHYMLPSDSEVHDVLMAIQAKKVMSDKTRRTYGTDQLYFKDQEEMWTMFDYAPDALINTALIARRCNVSIDFDTVKLPKFTVPKQFNMNNTEFLLDLCFKGAKERYDNVKGEVEERIKYEVGVVQNMGYVDYFLITWDFFRFCMDGTDNISDAPMKDWIPIIVGPGRGSGAGSIMLYCLGITDIDPLKYDLMFERFLDPSRISLPDIDSDFQDTRRVEVIDYVIRKYGRNSVSQIITFGSIAARGSMRDVGRVLEYSYAEVDKLCKMVPISPGVTLDDTLEDNPDFKYAYENDERARKLIDISRRLVGTLKHSSTHAAGVLITDEKGVQAHVPLWKNKDSIVCQYDMGKLEDLGLLKMDFLGLKTLGIIGYANDSIKKREGEFLPQSWLADEDDLLPLELIGRGYTQGIFQLEGAGMTSFMKEMKPVNLEEWIAGISLYRPGPMQYIPEFLRNRRDPSKILYPLKGLEDILSPSFGMLTYQEQCMKAVIEVAGYDKSDSDSFRKIIAKKKKELIPLHRKWFIEGRNKIDVDEYGKQKDYGHSIPGGIKLGHPREALEKFFHEMEEFGKYAFNKSHAAAYMRVGLMCARLKYYYPADFMAATMSYASQDKMSMYSAHCAQDLGIKVIPPDINLSEELFVPLDEKSIACSLSIKNSKVITIKALIENRNRNGIYKDFNDFIMRNIDTIDKSTLTSLAYCEAFRSINIKGSMVIASIENLMKEIKKAKDKIKKGRLPGLDFEASLVEISDFPESVALRMEKEHLGFYVTKNPLMSFLYEIEKRGTITLDAYEYDIDEAGDIVMLNDDFHHGTVKIVGILESIDILFTKKDKKKMGKGIISDLTSSTSYLIWPNDFEKMEDVLNADEVYEFTGRIMMKDNEAPVFIISSVVMLETTKVKRVSFMTTSDKTGKLLDDIKNCLRGNNPVYINFGNVRMCLPRSLWIDLSSKKNMQVVNEYSHEILHY